MVKNYRNFGENEFYIKIKMIKKIFKKSNSKSFYRHKLPEVGEKKIIKKNNFPENELKQIDTESKFWVKMIILVNLIKNTNLGEKTS